MKRFAMLCGLVLFGGGASVVAALEIAAPVTIEDFEEERSALRKSLADGLYDVGKWCHKKKWYAERDRLYREAVAADPEHLKARKALGFKRNRDGSWEQPEEPEVQRNRGRVDLDEIEAQVAKVLDDWHTDVHALLAKYKDDVGQDVYQVEMKLILKRFPKDEVAHQALGHVPGWEGRPWVSKEVKASYERRKELKDLVAGSRTAGGKFADLEPRDFEGDLTWEASGKNPLARAFSKTGDEDVKVALEVANAAQVLFNEGMGIEVELPEGLTFYLVEDNAQLVEVAEAHTKGKGAGLETVGAFWLDWRSMVNWGESTTIRLDGVSRQTVSWLLKHKFQLTDKQGWAWEGIGLYLSYRLCGTRLRFFVRESDYDRGADRSDNLRDPDVNWLKLAKDVLQNQRPNMKFLLGKDVNNMTERELLVSYALGAYLVEGRKAELPGILARIAKEPSTTVLEEVLGLDPDQLGDELLEWLDALY